MLDSLKSAKSGHYLLFFSTGIRKMICGFFFTLSSRKAYQKKCTNYHHGNKSQFHRNRNFQQYYRYRRSSSLSGGNVPGANLYGRKW